MPLLFIDYTNLILKAYEERRENNLLSRLLMHPTTANLRQECLNVYNERIKKGELEENTLRAFFGVPPSGKNFGHVIEGYHADRFRPLRKLIQGEIKNPAIITVELLAWLIDFTPRPLGHAQKIFRNTNDADISASQVTDTVKLPFKTEETNSVTEANEVSSAENTLSTESILREEKEKDLVDNKEPADLFTKNLTGIWQRRRSKIVTITGLSIMFLFGGIYMIARLQKSISSTNCMYWADDHYESAPCNEKPKGGRQLLPLDENLMKNFKRITQEDTITDRSIGMIYYISVDGKPEYYTSDGNHPVYITRHLKVLSQYMFDTHLRKKTISGKDASSEQ